jgi:hypothetical protein
MKSVLPHCCNKQQQDVHRAGQSVGGRASQPVDAMAVTVGCSTLQPIFRETVFHYATVLVFIPGFCSTTSRTSSPMSCVLVLQCFHQSAARVNVPLALRLQWFGSKISYLDTVVLAFLVGTNGYLQRYFLPRTHKCMVHLWTPPLKPLPYPQHTIHSALCSTALHYRTAVTVLKANARTHHPNLVNVHQRADKRLHRLQYVSVFVLIVFC